MAVDADDLRERAWVTRHEPPIDPVDETLWVAEDPVTDCAGLGRVEPEAVGNLVAVVAQFERRESSEPLQKLPGRVLERRQVGTHESASLFDRLQSLF
jgi:hypothetical protein